MQVVRVTEQTAESTSFHADNGSPPMLSTIGPRMTTVDTVSHERGLRPRFALVAGLAGVLLFAGTIVESAGPQARVGELTVQLLVTDRRAGLEILGAVLNGLGVLGLMATLWFLWGAVKARRPEISPAVRITALVGGVVAAVGGVGYGVIITQKAHDFATHGLQTYPQADALLHSSSVALLQYAGLVGSLLLAIGFVLVALNAMRVGLLTKMVGYIGIAAAAASLLLVGSAPALLIEVFWLLATAVLLAGRWPNGDPPAWSTGQAVPWPTSAQLREQRQRSSGRPGRPAPAKPAKPQREPVAARASAPAAGPRRKRKRRK
jgi:hypothetical protein